MKHIHLTMRDLNHIIITELQRGKSVDELVSVLRQRGWPEVTARQFIANVRAEVQRPVPASAPMERASEPATEEDEAHIGSALWLIALLCIALLLLAL